MKNKEIEGYMEKVLTYQTPQPMEELEAIQSYVEELEDKIEELEEENNDLQEQIDELKIKI